MGFITGLVYVIISFVTGLFLIGLSLNIFDLPMIFEYLHNQFLQTVSLRVIVGLVGALVIYVCLKFLQLLIKSSKRDQMISFTSPQGKASITLYALEELLKKTLEAKPEISHVRPRVILVKNGIEVAVKSNLNKEANILDITNMLQGLIKDKLENFLGKDKEIKVKLVIQKVALDKKSREKATEEEEPEVPFRNY